MLTNSPLTPDNIRRLRAALDDFTSARPGHSHKTTSKRTLQDLLFSHANGLVAVAEATVKGAKPKRVSKAKKSPHPVSGTN
jgi:hypothetical protein